MTNTVRFIAFLRRLPKQVLCQIYPFRAIFVTLIRRPRQKRLESSVRFVSRNALTSQNPFDIPTLRRAHPKATNRWREALPYLRNTIVLGLELDSFIVRRAHHSIGSFTEGRALRRPTFSPPYGAK